MNRIINALEIFEGPSMKECMKILRRLLTYEDHLRRLICFARRKSIESSRWI